MKLRFPPQEGFEVKEIDDNTVYIKDYHIWLNDTYTGYYYKDGEYYIRKE